MEKTPVSKETKKAKKKKKKPLEKFDLKQLESVGILYQKGNATDDMAKMEVEDQVFVIKSFWVVSPDATKWKHFNLYNDSLGRKGKVPEFDDSDVVKAELSGDLEAIEKYLSKKGYDKV